MSSKEENECSICLNNNEKEKYTTQCNHTFHKDCLDEWLTYSTTCPQCRTTIYEHKKTYCLYLVNNFKYFLKYLCLFNIFLLLIILFRIFRDIYKNKNNVQVNIYWIISDWITLTVNYLIIFIFILSAIFPLTFLIYFL